MKQIIFLLCCCTCILFTQAQVNGDYRSNGTVTLTSATNWQVYSGGSWSTAATAPNGNVTSGNTITIQSGHTWNGNTAAANIPAGVTLLFQGLAGGTWTANTLTINGTYIHFTTASTSNVFGAINASTGFATGSTVIYRAATGVTPSAVYGGRTYYNLTFDTDGSVNPAFSTPAPGSEWYVNGKLTVNGWKADFYHATNTFGQFNGDIWITGTGSVLRVKNCTVAAGKTLTIDAGDSLAVGNTYTLTINGSLINKSTKAISLSTNTGFLVFGSTGVYQHDANGGTIPNTNTTYNNGSTIQVTGITNVTNIPVLPVSCGNVVWNCTAQTSSNTFINTAGANTTTINGNFTVQSTGAGNAAIYLGGAGTARTLNVMGNIVVNGGKLGIIKAASGATADQTCNVTGDVIVNGGEFYISDANGATSTGKGYLNVSGSLTHTAGTFGSSATAVANSGVLNFNGNNTNKNISTVGLANNTNIIINKTATGNIALQSSLTIGSSATLTVASGTLNCNGNMVTLHSTSASNTARVYVTAGAGIDQTLTGSKFTVEQFIPGGTRAYRFLGHPFNSAINLSELTDDIDITGNDGNTAVAGTGFSSTATNNPSAFWYDVATGNGTTSAGWTAFTRNDGVTSAANTSNTWNIAQGIRVLIRGTKGQAGILDANPPAPNDVTLHLSGKINDGSDVPVTLTKGANSGFNMISNPYCAPLDVYQFRTANSNENAAAGANFYVWVPTGGVNGKGQYITGDMTNSGESYRYLPAYSSFFVNVAATGNVTFKEAHKAAATQAATYNLRTAGTSAYGNNTIQLQVSRNNTFEDRLLILLNDGKTSNAFDTKDALKLDNSNLNFYSISSDNKHLSIDRRPLHTAIDSVIALGFSSSTPGNYSIDVKDLAIDDNATVYLRDKFLSTETILAQGTSYSFAVTANAASQGENRFALVFRSAPKAVELTNADFNMQLSPNPVKDRLHITFSNKATADTHITITNSNGQIIRQLNAGNVLNGNLTIDVRGLTKGAYYVTLNNGTTKNTQQLLIQ